MKTQILIAFATLLFSATAFACGTTMHLETNENHWYSIRIDNKSYPEFYGNIDIYDIPAGTHKVRIEKFKRYRPDRYSSKTVVFKGNIDFPYCGDVAGHFNERQGTLKLLDLNRRPSQSPNHYVEPPISDCDARSPQGANGPRPHPRHNDVIGHKMQRRNNNHQHNKHQYDPRLISERSFYELVDDVRNTNYDHNRKHIIQYAIDNHNFTSAQIKRLVQLLDYDHSRLDIAKYAYRSVVDPTNYNIIFSEFDYDHSVRSLVDYIKHG